MCWKRVAGDTVDQHTARIDKGRQVMVDAGPGEPGEAGRVHNQHFPYTVHDIHGSTVYPENLGNITESEQNNHATRDPQFLISRARAHLAVRESTASFFFHPYLDINYLKDTVEGIQELGYEFVPVTELK